MDDKVSLLHCNWIAVTSRAEEWLNLLLVRNKHPNLYYVFIIHQRKLLLLEEKCSNFQSFFCFLLFTCLGLPEPDAEVRRTDKGSE